MIIKLGFQGTIRGFDIDATHYEDNYPLKARVEACLVEDDGIKKEGGLEYQVCCMKPPLLSQEGLLYNYNGSLVYNGSSGNPSCPQSLSNLPITFLPFPIPTISIPTSG